MRLVPLLLLLLLGLAVASSGCASARKRSDTTILRDLAFEGLPKLPVGDLTNYAVSGQLAQQESPPFLLTWPLSAWLEPAIARPHLQEHDRERVLVYLAHQGYFDAELTWETKAVRKERRHRAGVQDLVGHVVLGPTTRWDAVPELVWSDVPPASVKDDVLRAQSMIHPEGRFRLEDATTTRDALLRYLKDQGLAHATVEMDLEARPDERTAHVRYALRAGPVATLGAVHVDDVDAAREAVVLHLADLRPGDAYSASELEDAWDRLQSTGAFDRVVLAEGGAPDSTVVPVDVELLPALPRQLELALSAGWEGQNFKPLISWSRTNTDVAGRLGKRQLTFVTGFGLLQGELIPVVRAGYELDLPSPTLGHTFDFGVQSDIYELLLPRTDGTVGWEGRTPLARHLTLAFGPRATWTRLGLPDGLAEESAVIAAIGPGFQNQYGLVELDTRVTLDQVRSRERRRLGYETTFIARGILPIAAGGPFVRLEADARWYAAPHRPVLGRPLQLMVRGELRQLVGADDELPYPERLLLGGSSHHRGFRSGQVGAYDCACVERPTLQGSEPVVRRHYLPQGGLSSSLFTAEVQLHRVLLSELTLAAFADLGSLGADPRVWVRPDAQRVAVGAGVRYETAIGPFRLDASVRPLYPEDAGADTYYNCDADESLRRSFDVFSDLGRAAAFDRTLPAFNVFVGIGESL